MTFLVFCPIENYTDAGFLNPCIHPFMGNAGRGDILFDNDYAAPFMDGKFTYPSQENFNNPAGYQKVSWGWPAFFVDTDPTSTTRDRFYIYGARFRTTASFEAINKSTYGISNYYQDNAYIVTQFALPELPATEAEFGQTVTLYPTDIQDQFTTEYDVYVTQGGTMYQGRIYYSFGLGGKDATQKAAIRAIDIAEKEIIAKIDLSDSVFYAVEPESSSIYNGKLTLSMINCKVYEFEYIESVWQEDVAATCEQNGVKKTVDCLTGNTLRAESTPATDHSYGNDDICTICGKHRSKLI